MQNRAGERERPHFFGFRRPKSVVGSLPPSGTTRRAAFFPREPGFQTKHKSTKEKHNANR